MGDWSNDSKTTSRRWRRDFGRPSSRSRSTRTTRCGRARRQRRHRHRAQGGPRRRGRDRRRRGDAPARARPFLAEQIETPGAGRPLSLHLKATMRKSRPDHLGHACGRSSPTSSPTRRRARQGRRQSEHGLASILSALEDLPGDEREAIEAATRRPTSTGRTWHGRLRPRDHQHARPSDVIVDPRAGHDPHFRQMGTPAATSRTRRP